MNYKKLEITDYLKDYGYCRYAAYSGRKLVIQTNDSAVLLDAVADFFAEEPKVIRNEQVHPDLRDYINSISEEVKDGII